jgi:SulP family sulfate permease
VLVPKLVTALKTYNRQQAVADVTAGIIVGVVALPLAIAFAIASGVGPQAGLYTAIIAGFLISALGGSRVQIGGPTGAFVVIVYGIVQQYGIDGLTVATMMAGVILIVLGVWKLGGAIKFIPAPVVTGFTSGIAVIIFSGELRDFFGIKMPGVPADFIAKVEAYAAHADAMTPSAVAVGALTLAILVLWPRVSRKIPAPFVALVVTTALVQLAHLPVETIGSRFGGIDASFPVPHLPTVALHDLSRLVAPAFAIAMLGGIESLLSAVVADGMIGGRHRSNMELVAQGVANVITPLFGGIPATGAIARTATNIKAGGRTPVAGIVHSITLLMITLFFGRWAALIPMATLAGILVVVAYHMSEWRTFRAMLTAPRSDVVVLLVTFGLTVLVDLTVALGVGMVLASFMFMKKMAEATHVTAVTDMFGDDGADADEAGIGTHGAVEAGVQIYEIDGPFFFGAAETFKETMGSIERAPKVLILRMRRVGLLDATGIALITDLLKKGKRDGTALILSEVDSQPMAAMTRSGLYDVVGAANFANGITEALARAHEIVAGVPRQHVSP